MLDRWRRVDPLLPSAVPWAAAPHCGAPLVVSGASDPGDPGDPSGRGGSGGTPVAVGGCEHWAGAPGSMDLSWGAGRRFRLAAEVAGPDVGGGLDALLGRWRDHLAGLPAAGDADTAAVVDWPCRDVDGIAALLRHGLAPLEVLAARTARRGTGRSNQTFGMNSSGGTTRRHLPAAEPRPAAGPDASGVRIRRGEPGDARTVARLGLEIIRWDSRFGTVHERPDTLDALTAEAAGLLAGPAPWTWLAERDGEAVGVLAAQRPEAAGWVAPMTGAAPAAYLMLMYVTPGERGGGAGAALAGRFHRAADEAGVAVTLLHYELLNPLSAPFWNGHGYRPLWTTWQATPARVVR